MFVSGQDPQTRRHFLLAAGLGAAAVGAVHAAAPPSRAASPRPAVVSRAGGAKTYLLAFDKGEEVMAGLLAFVKRQRIVAGQISAIGAVSDAVLAFFDRSGKQYKRIPVARQAEVTSLTGNVATKQGEPFLHVHAVLGLPDGSARTGHLLEAHVWPTLEVVLTAWPEAVVRELDRETGLYLLRP
jgi:predicted DNA-binding protein with PD1-like motif